MDFLKYLIPLLMKLESGVARRMARALPIDRANRQQATYGAPDED
jgi:hypothetical protein